MSATGPVVQTTLIGYSPANAGWSFFGVESTSAATSLRQPTMAAASEQQENFDRLGCT